MNTIGENIKKFRTFRKITQVELGNALGRSKNVVSNWERGDNAPDLDTLEKICKILKVTPNQIFGWEPCPEYVRYEERLRMHVHKINELARQKDDIERKLAEAKREMEDDIFPEE